MRTDITNFGPVPVIPRPPRGPSGNQDEASPLLADLKIFHEPYHPEFETIASHLLGRIKDSKSSQTTAVLLGALQKLDPILAAKESGIYLDHNSRLVQISAAKNVLGYKIQDNEEELFSLQNKALDNLEGISSVAKKNKLDDKTLSRLALAVFDLYPLYKDSPIFDTRFKTMKDLALDRLNEALKKPDIKLENKLRILKALMVPGIVTEAKARWDILTSFAQGLYELGHSDKTLRKELMSRVNIAGPLREEFAKAYYSTFHHRRDIQ